MERGGYKYCLPRGARPCGCLSVSQGLAALFRRARENQIAVLKDNLGSVFGGACVGARTYLSTLSSVCPSAFSVGGTPSTSSSLTTWNWF